MTASDGGTFFGSFKSLRTPLLVAFCIQFVTLFVRNSSQLQSASTPPPKEMSITVPDFLKFSDELIAMLSIGGVSIFQMFMAELNLSREARRRIQHASTGQLLVGISYFMEEEVAKIALGAGICLLLYVVNFHHDWYKTKFGSLLRKNEMAPRVLPGAFYFLLGSWMTLMSFDIHLTRYGILVLSYADPMAAWIGQNSNSPKLNIGTATLSGTRACFTISAFIGWLCLEGDKVGILVGAAAATAAEILPIGNDNLNIPIAAAAAVTLARHYEAQQDTLDYQDV